MFIRTQRLFLRPAFAEDWGEVLAGIGEESVVRQLARAPWPYGERDAREFCERPFDPAAPSLLVTLPATPGAPVIGGCGYGPRHDGEGTELGYWIARRHSGVGYATEAARALVETARHMGLAGLDAGHFTDNPASGRVLAKAGFRATGTVRARYSAGRAGVATCLQYRIDLGQGAADGAGRLMVDA